MIEEFSKLLVKHKDEILDEYKISKNCFTVGRQANNDITLNDSQVSKHHVKIELEDGKYILTDLASTNGTLVNGKKIDQIELRSGYEITLGNHILIFRSDDTITIAPNDLPD